MEDATDQPQSDPDFIINPDGSITVDTIVIPPAPTPALTNEATKERLIITELNVRDFKSYAGSHTIGPFNKNFSCIVGPNGSGKSNVIDALLFVFGYRAQKIRSKKVSVLIHKSHMFPDLPSCSVTVNFATIKDEGKDFITLPDSQFSVTRTGYKDNSSTYEVDGRRKQYKDVANLLKKYGIDLDYNRFMILQGEIELISMMKPKAVSENDPGMLEYIEDIIGSHRFIEPTKHFNTKVEELNEVRLQKMNMLKLVEKEMADAEKPRNKAMEYLRLANKLTLMENSVLQVQITLANEERQKLVDKKNSVLEKLKETSTDSEQLEDAKHAKDKEMKNITKEFEGCSKAVDEFKQQFTSLERADTACRENLKNIKEKIKKLEKSLETEELKTVNLKNQPNTLRKEIEELETKRGNLDSSKAAEEEKLKEVMDSMQEEIGGFQEEKDKFEKELADLKSIALEKKSQLDLAQSELDLFLSNENKQQENLAALQTDYKEIADLIKAEEMSLEKGKDRISQLNSQLSSGQDKLISVSSKEEFLTKEIKSIRLKLDEAKSSLSSSESHNSMTAAFLTEKKKGKLTGVLGRLGDLGAIDAKYDVAISTACGSLDHIVTDTVATAQECVNFLKAKNLGYTTFIPLEKMKTWESYTQRKITTPENVPRLFDLISVKNKDILPAFYFALQNTLVAKDLEQATRVGYQYDSRYRVVTLKGELIDLSGTMSGGGSKVSKGRMGQAVVDNSCSKQEVEKMAAELETLTRELQEIIKARTECTEVIDQGKKELAALQHTMKKSQMNYNGYVEREKMLSKQIKEQKNRILASAPDPQKVAGLQEQIKKHETKYTKANNETITVEDKVKRLQTQILEITKGKYGAAQKKIDKFAKEINTISQNISKMKVTLKSSEKNLNKAEEKISSLKLEIEECKKRKEEFQNEYKSLETKGLEISDKKKEAEEMLLACELMRTKISTEAKEISTRIHQLKSEVIELKNQIKMSEIDVRANEGQLKTFQQRLAKLELHNIEEGPTELPVLTEEEMNEVAVNAVQMDIGHIQNQMKDMNPDLSAIAEFKKKEEMYREKLKDLEDTVSERDHFRQIHEALRKQRLQEFMRGFSIITLKVKELYQMMTLGGDAELELVDSVDPFSEGIEFSVRPLRKSWKSIRNLSGGEKTLSSLSLVFALHYYRTTPFFVMDEIDAALDFRNVSIIGSYIKDCTKNSQFIVISLRENMFLLADHLIGIYKTNNRTKNVYISPPPEELVEENLTPIKGTNDAFDKLKNTQPDRTHTKKPLVGILRETTIPSNLIGETISLPGDDKTRSPVSIGDTALNESKESYDSFVFNTPATKMPVSRKISFLDEVEASRKLEANKTPAVKPARSKSASILKKKSKTPAKTPRSRSVAFNDENQETEGTTIRRSQRLQTPKTQEKSKRSSDGEAVKKTPAKARSSKKSVSISEGNEQISELKTPSRSSKSLAETLEEWSDDEDFVFKTPTAKTPKLKTSFARATTFFSDEDD